MGVVDLEAGALLAYDLRGNVLQLSSPLMELYRRLASAMSALVQEQLVFLVNNLTTGCSDTYANL